MNYMIPIDPKPGHELLIEHLIAVLKDALAFEYHDYKSTLLAPKLELCNNLAAIVYNAQRGEYNNEPDDEDIINYELIDDIYGMLPEIKENLINHIKRGNISVQSKIKAL